MNTMELFQLTGKVAVVTGGYGLYGKNISQALCEAGATIVIAARNESKCAEFARKLTASGGKAVGMALDLASEAEIGQFVGVVTERFGRLDILVNNAVLRVNDENLEDVKTETIEKEAKVNVTGMMLLTAAACRQMRIQKSGNIINISSIRGIDGPNFPIYGETGMTSGVNYTFEKWGYVGFTKWLANYYGKYNIRANCISPGGYLDDANCVQTEFVENYKRLTPLGRFACDDDIKGPVVFLASDASAYLTGHNLVMDGGWSNW